MQSLTATVKIQRGLCAEDLVLPILGAWQEVLDWRVGDRLKWSKRPSGDRELNNLPKAKRDGSAITADRGGTGNAATQGKSNHDYAD